MRVSPPFCYGHVMETDAERCPICNPQGYLDAVSDTIDAEPCCYGHYGCALRNGGPCSNEVAGTIEELD